MINADKLWKILDVIDSQQGTKLSIIPADEFVLLLDLVNAKLKESFKQKIKEEMVAEEAGK